MIEKIAKDVLDKLNATRCRDFDGMVGLEAHLSEIQSLLDLDYDGVKMVAITGPAGIGKTTIARALHGLLSNRFQLSCFVDNLRGSYHSGFDTYGLKLHLQQQFLSKVLNQSGMRICHLGAVKENLSDQRVLIILDDVNNLKQLEALANETTWFGPGSRIVVTTENKELLQQHGINNTYHVRFPSRKDALKILCIYAFRQTSPCHGFEELSERVTELCGKLPLGLCVMGSSLRGKKENEWEDVVSRLETILDRDIEDVLSVGYESLDENEQTLFLHIAVFFNYRNGDLVETMFADSDLDVKYGLKILENRSLIEMEIFAYGRKIVMHRLLQQLGKKAIHKQEPWKRQILVDAPEICDVLEYAKGTRAVSGISFDISNIDDVSISERAFKRMPNLRFLRVYKSKSDGNYRMHIPEEMEFPRRLRLLEWEAYPSKSLPPTFNPKYLVELDMQQSELVKLWEGPQALTNLKKMNLSASYHLKELPDLSSATNLEELNLEYCESLVEIPSSFSHLHKLNELWMDNCINLQVIPAHMNLASLEWVTIKGCSRLKNIPLMSSNIITLNMVENGDVHPSIRLCSRLESVNLGNSGKLKGLTHLPKSVTYLDLSNSDIEKIPDCIKALHRLEYLFLCGCRRLASLPELPRSLVSLKAGGCESMETVFSPFNTPDAQLKFTNCYKLSQQATRAIIQHSFHCAKNYYPKPSMFYIPGTSLLPGREVPAEFDHRAMGNTLTVILDVNRSYGRFVFCVVISPKQQTTIDDPLPTLYCRCIGQSYLHPFKFVPTDRIDFERKHLFTFRSGWIINKDPSQVNKESDDLRVFYRPEVNTEMMFEFSSEYDDFDIVECGAKILTQEESIAGSYESESEQVFGGSNELEEAIVDDTEYNEATNIDGETYTGCWSWLFVCFDLLVSGRRR
ncbi:PREDICTED: disease resistance protein RML1B-like isoform X2 [Camelina sativa]|nr:PREDICTED: disease resistance protein RML1B-like isoform X2 [Camelina sativa]